MTLEAEYGVLEDVETLMHRVIGAATEVHRHLGPGFGEKVYEQALGHELGLRGMAYEQQKELVVPYKGVRIPGQRVSMLVEGKLILDLKAVEQIAPIHEAQLLSHLKTAGLPVGMIINFNAKQLRSGIKRLTATWPV